MSKTTARGTAALLLWIIFVMFAYTAWWAEEKKSVIDEVVTYIGLGAIAFVAGGATKEFGKDIINKINKK